MVEKISFTNPRLSLVIAISNFTDVDKADALFPRFGLISFIRLDMTRDSTGENPWNQPYGNYNSSKADFGNALKQIMESKRLSL